MHIETFKSIVRTFIDPGTEVLFEGPQVVISVNGDLITVSLSEKQGEVYIEEDGMSQPAIKWVLTRLARFDLLAQRLVENVITTPHFVSPTACLLPSSGGDQEDNSFNINPFEAINQTIKSKSPFETSVVYITSDAGEGKTSFINQFAYEQAVKYKEKAADWLMVPIPLGGRHFLRFDDITIGALQNRYRFPFLYYESFLALVKIGVLVPAYDGFEEMFVEGSTGEALSAMGILVNSLESRGSIVVAARKAYFEFENIKSQQQLFDTVREHSVRFEKLELNRWAKSEFIAYCKKRSVPDPENLYKDIQDKIGKDHALLTRAVLVNRLVEVALDSNSIDEFIAKVEVSGADFFAVFVRGLIEREAVEKWLDRSGEAGVGRPLLSIAEHCELLGLVALSMWENRIDFIKRDSLDFVAELYCENVKKEPEQTHQIRERIRGHAMLIPSKNANNAVEFDHDEFRRFFLGEHIFKVLKERGPRLKAEILGIFRRGQLAKQTQYAFIRAVLRDKSVLCKDVVDLLLSVGSMESQTSYAHTNCSDIIIRLLNGQYCQDISVSNLSFSGDSLRERKLFGISFKNCFFLETSTKGSSFNNCSFEKCTFMQINIFDSTEFNACRLIDCKIESITFPEKNYSEWQPSKINMVLSAISGLEIDLMPMEEVPPPIPLQHHTDPEIFDVDKLIRYLMRSTTISESIINKKMGDRSALFTSNTLPKLLACGILKEVPNKGSGDQRRFKLGVSLQRVHEALRESDGLFTTFVAVFESNKD